MNEIKRDALVEVIDTVEGLRMFLTALEQDETCGEPTFELIKDRLESLADFVRGTMHVRMECQPGEHVH